MLSIDIDHPLIPSTKLNRNSEKMPNARTNDMISENDHAFIKRVVEEGKKDSAYTIDMIFPPICNFHTSEYRSIQNRWG